MTLPISPRSQMTKNWLAIKIELYVPTTAPTATTSSSPRILGPPMSSKASSTNNVVKLVFKDLRVSEESEETGLDLSEHSESAYAAN